MRKLRLREALTADHHFVEAGFRIALTASSVATIPLHRDLP